MRICPRTVILDVNFASFKIAWYGLPKHFWQYLDSFQLLLYCKRERETTCLFVLAHPIVNSHFRYQSSTWVLNTKFDRVLVLFERSSRKKLDICQLNYLFCDYEMHKMRGGNFRATKLTWVKFSELFEGISLRTGVMCIRRPVRMSLTAILSDVLYFLQPVFKAFTEWRRKPRSDERFVCNCKDWFSAPIVGYVEVEWRMWRHKDERSEIGWLRWHLSAIVLGRHSLI